MTTPAHLDPSELGTKSYWDNAYKKEYQNWKSNPDDEGTIWFSDSGAEEKVIAYLENLATDGLLLKKRDPESPPATSFLDLGTGNGHLLFALRDAGWEGHMLGVDYSADSVKLARDISRERVQDHYVDSIPEEFEVAKDMLPVKFSQYDILNPIIAPGMLSGGFDILLDKGTFDAISLSSEVDAKGRRVSETYCEKIKPLLRDSGLFIITSCNWTEEELKAWFLKDTSTKGGVFMLKDRIKYKTFSFGGKKGQSVVTLCFQKKAEERGHK